MISHQHYIPFQSLFWWRGSLDGGVVDGTPASGRFQSLFWWRGSLDRPLAHDCRLPHIVSILVLVERQFGPVHVCGHASQLCVSILVLVERPFGPFFPFNYIKHIVVSILVLVERPFGL